MAMAITMNLVHLDATKIQSRKNAKRTSRTLSACCREWLIDTWEKNRFTEKAPWATGLTTGTRTFKILASRNGRRHTIKLSYGFDVVHGFHSKPGGCHTHSSLDQSNSSAFSRRRSSKSKLFQPQWFRCSWVSSWWSSVPWSDSSISSHLINNSSSHCWTLLSSQFSWWWSSSMRSPNLTSSCGLRTNLDIWARNLSQLATQAKKINSESPLHQKVKKMMTGLAGSSWLSMLKAIPSCSRRLNSN